MNASGGDDCQSSFDSGDCTIIFDDGPGDNSIRDCAPDRLLILKAERDKLIRWGVPLPPLPPHIEQMLRQQLPREQSPPSKD